MESRVGVRWIGQGASLSERDFQWEFASVEEAHKAARELEAAGFRVTMNEAAPS